VNQGLIFSQEALQPWYEKIESNLAINQIPENCANRNAEIFRDGFQTNSFQSAPLERGQTDCMYKKGMNCIECLSGCRINSKQSTLITFLREAFRKGLEIFSEFEVSEIVPGKVVQVHGLDRHKKKHTFKAPKIVLASGAIGNSKLLIKSNFANKNIGKHFYTHPQYMLFGTFEEKVDSFKGPLQSYKSADQGFRLKGFKLENIFAPPVAASMLIKGYGKRHQNMMKKISHLASVEVAIRDTNPGTIRVGKNGKTVVHKTLNDEDLKRKNLGYDAIRNILYSQGAKCVFEGEFGIGLHLMGGCRIGKNEGNSVVSPEFHLHRHKNIFCADSSIFPNAPGINPSHTIMALSKMLGDQIK